MLRAGGRRNSRHAAPQRWDGCRDSIPRLARRGAMAGCSHLVGQAIAQDPAVPGRGCPRSRGRRSFAPPALPSCPLPLRPSPRAGRHSSRGVSRRTCSRLNAFTTARAMIVPPTPPASVERQEGRDTLPPTVLAGRTPFQRLGHGRVRCGAASAPALRWPAGSPGPRPSPRRSRVIIGGVPRIPSPIQARAEASLGLT